MKPTPSELGPDFATRAQNAANPHLAIEALRDLLTEESAAVSQNNLVRQRAFSQKAPRVDEPLHQPATDFGRGDRRTPSSWPKKWLPRATEVVRFTPPLSSDELFYDSLATNELAP